jgi:putative Ca2+/H+ antiporter (TMEM165/GDT1 family)
VSWQLFFSVYTLIFVAELPDKTAFATLLMATRGRPLAIFVGVAAAFLVQTVVAVAFGELFGFLPASWVQCSAGLLFFAFAIHTWRHKDDVENEPSTDHGLACVQGFWSCAFKSFIVIFIAEWGDLTQIATASLMAKFNDHPLTVFTAALLALWTVSAIAVFIGQKAKDFINPVLLKKISVVLFLVIGCYFIWTWLNVRS